MKDREYLWEKGSNLFEEGEYKKSIQVFTEMYNQFPDEHACLLKIGFCYILLDKPKMVIKYFEKYLDIDDSKKHKQKEENRWRIFQNLGISYTKLSHDETNLRKAYEYFQKAIEIDAKPKSFLYLGEVSNLLGEEDLAINYWKTAAKLGNGAAMMALNSRGIEI